MSGPNELERALKGHVLDQAELKVSTAEDAGFDSMYLVFNASLGVYRFAGERHRTAPLASRRTIETGSAGGLP